MLVAEQQPLAPVRDRPRGVGPDVTAALALGEEHPALPGLVGVEAVQAGDEEVPDRERGVAFDDVGGPAGHTERAVGGGLALAEQVGARRGDHRRDGALGVVVEPDEPAPHEVGLVGGPGGMVLDLADVVAPPVVAVQDRAVGVGDLGAGGEGLAHQLAVLGDVLLGELPVVGIGEVAVEQEGEVRIQRVPVEPDRLVVFGVVGEHGIHRTRTRSAQVRRGCVAWDGTMCRHLGGPHGSSPVQRPPGRPIAREGQSMRRCGMRRDEPPSRRARPPLSSAS